MPTAMTAILDFGLRQVGLWWSDYELVSHPDQFRQFQVAGDMSGDVAFAAPVCHHSCHRRVKMKSGRPDLNRGPPAPKDGGQRPPVLIRADFHDSALTVGHQR